jgi:hypothetical protein
MSIIKKTIQKKNKIELKEIYDEIHYYLNEYNNEKGLHISFYSNINIRKINPNYIDINFTDYDVIDIYILFNPKEEIKKLGEQYSFESIDKLPENLYHIYGWEKDGGISCIY